ncbi:MAG: hypothetical protein EBZ29_12085, partial [Synechococcaceae bacterium WB9_4xC_028]|nr:hypothetical protein [Synechococcaceae bacterium WB9_4xC_028]
LTASDPDNADTATFSLIGDPIPGLTLNPDGSWSFDPDDAAYDSLADGEQLTITVPYQVSDGIGATATSSFLIKLNGTNLAPTLDAPLAAPTLREGDGAFALNLLTGARDPDTGSLASLLSISDITYSIDGANPSSEVPDGLVLNGAVLVVDPSHSAFEHLAEGDTLTVVVSYSIADAQGATVAQTATVTITGSNNAPTITLAADQAATEAGAAISGQLTASDPDNADTATFSLIGDPIPGLTLNPDGSWFPPTTISPTDRSFLSQSATASQTTTLHPLSLSSPSSSQAPTTLPPSRSSTPTPQRPHSATAPPLLSPQAPSRPLIPIAPMSSPPRSPRWPSAASTSRPFPLTSPLTTTQHSKPSSLS